jgi:ferric-dicitrate binding protein FerR (iron transport regulator)
MKLKIWVSTQHSGDGRRSTELMVDARTQSEIPDKDKSDWLIATRVLITLFAMCCTSLDWLHLGSRAWQIYTTEIGITKSVRLADGTTVLLNTNSEIRVQFSPWRRSVYLIRGEALFTVAHNQDWPFDVTAENVTTRDVGTAFDLRLTEDHELYLAVREGRVRVGSSAEFNVGDSDQLSRLAMVQAGGMAVASDGMIAVIPHRTAEVTRRLAWTQGQLVLNGQTLTQVVHEINRYNRDQIRISDVSIARLMMGGVINPRNLRDFLAYLQVVHQIVAVESGKTLDGGSVLNLCGPRSASSCSSGQVGAINRRR